MDENAPILVPVPGKESGDRWILTGYWDGHKNHTGDWIKYFELDGVKYRHKLEFGIRADGSSVPRWLRPLLKMGGRDGTAEEWLPHDDLYRRGRVLPPGILGRWDELKERWVSVTEIDRQFADKMFTQGLKNKKYGLSSWKQPVAKLALWAAFWKNF